MNRYIGPCNPQIALYPWLLIFPHLVYRQRLLEGLSKKRGARGSASRVKRWSRSSLRSGGRFGSRFHFGVQHRAGHRVHAGLDGAIGQTFEKFLDLGSHFFRNFGVVAFGEADAVIRGFQNVSAGFGQRSAFSQGLDHVVHAVVDALGGAADQVFCAGGLATPADAALAMQLGAQAVFVGSGIFKSSDPAPRAKAIVEATTHFRDPQMLAKVSKGLGMPMTGIGMDELEVTYADRGW